MLSVIYKPFMLSVITLSVMMLSVVVLVYKTDRLVTISNFHPFHYLRARLGLPGLCVCQPGQPSLMN